MSEQSVTSPLYHVTRGFLVEEHLSRPEASLVCSWSATPSQASCRCPNCPDHLLICSGNEGGGGLYKGPLIVSAGDTVTRIALRLPLARHCSSVRPAGARAKQRRSTLTFVSGDLQDFQKDVLTRYIDRYVDRLKCSD